MADLTQEIELTSEWLNISASLSSGVTYLGDIIKVETGTIVYQALTDNEDAPSDNITGHPWYATSQGNPAPSRRLSTTAGTTIWIKINTGSATLTLTRV